MDSLVRLDDIDVVEDVDVVDSGTEVEEGEGGEEDPKEEDKFIVDEAATGAGVGDEVVKYDVCCDCGCDCDCDCTDDGVRL